MPFLPASMRLSLFVALSLLWADAARPTAAQASASNDKAHTASPTVEVINGGSRVTQSFDAHRKVSPESIVSTRRKFRPEYVAGQVRRQFASAVDVKPEPAPANGVVILNGNQRETRVFNSSKDPGPARNLPPVVIGIATSASKGQPVVVGISSGAHDTQPVVVNVASAGSSAQPVVVGVASSGFQTAGAVQPVATGVSPRPAKRPPYRPAALDAQ
jgi:hypothetical protein